VKRKAGTLAKKPQKKRKTVSSDEESDAVMSDAPAKDYTPSDVESDPPKKLARRTKKVVTEDSDEEEPALNHVPRGGNEEEVEAGPAKAVSEKERETTPTADVKGDASDSEMSVLLDDSPAKKKQAKKPVLKKGAKEAKAKAPAVAKSKAKSKAKADDTPDQAEIKRLQSWLVKCGIRKVWVKELAKCDTDKQKIKHLKEMLQDAGMDGKYSNEKAATIKEQREFAKDLEAIQEGAKAWGGDDEDSGRPRRRAARAPPKVVPKYVEEDEDSDSDDNEDEVKLDKVADPATKGDDKYDEVKPKAKKAKKVEQYEGDDSEEDVAFDDNDDSDDEVKFSSSSEGSIVDDSE
jgi:hypothetical protein